MISLQSSSNGTSSQKKKITFHDEKSKFLQVNWVKTLIIESFSLAASNTKSVRDVFGIESDKSTKPKTVERPVNNPPVQDSPKSMSGRKRNPVTFDDDGDDLLAGLDKPKSQSKKPSSSLMDSLFGDSKGASDSKKTDKKEFVLDDKYKTGAAAKDTKPASSGGLGSTSAGKEDSSGLFGASGGRRGRRAGAATLEKKPPADFDEDKLFAGTSLASNPNAGAPPPPSPQVPVQAPAPQPAAQPQSAQPSWLQIGGGTQTATTQQQPGAPQSQIPQASQQLVQVYQQQLEQMQGLERQQQDQFQRDLEEQRRHMEAKQTEHRQLLDQQRNMCQEQVKMMQEKQSSIMKQQQQQAELLMKSIQTQMESELRMKSELVRNQLHLLAEIQSQNPESVLDMNEIMGQLQKTMGRGQISVKTGLTPAEDGNEVVTREK